MNLSFESNQNMGELYNLTHQQALGEISLGDIVSDNEPANQNTGDELVNSKIPTQQDIDALSAEAAAHLAAYHDYKN